MPSLFQQVTVHCYLSWEQWCYLLVLLVVGAAVLLVGAVVLLVLGAAVLLVGFTCCRAAVLLVGAVVLLVLGAAVLLVGFTCRRSSSVTCRSNGVTCWCYLS